MMRTKQIRKLIFLVAFTGIMLLTSTYAWFSAQREVTISGLEGIVEAAEGLQVSLDAETWTNSLDLSGTAITQKAYSENTNLLPTELLPISTTGTAIGETEIAMYRGINEGTKLNNIKAVDPAEDDSNEHSYPGYIAFDLFVKNTGDAKTAENLLLSKGSRVDVSATGVATAGLQNTVRVAFAKYSGVCTNVLADAKTITTATNATESKINQISIWEPNADKHVAKVETTFGSNTVKKEATPTYYTVADGTVLPTHALLAGAVDKEITDIYDWSGANSTYMTEQKTVQTKAEEVSENTDLTLTTDVNSKLTINANEITKLRVYVWLEGQDVDCINWASQGGGIQVNLGLTKDKEGTNSSGGNNSNPDEVIMLDGDGQTFYTLAPTALSFRSSADIGDFQEVQINGETIDESNYTMTKGSTIITLSIDYLKTLKEDNHTISIVSKTGSPSAAFSVVEPDKNSHGFYYNQPYTANLPSLGGYTAFFVRENGTFDLIQIGTEVISGEYTISGNDVTFVLPVIGTFTCTILPDGTEIYCNELETTAVLGDETFIADEDYIYSYDSSKGGYVVSAINDRKNAYSPIRTDINGKPTVALAECFLMENRLITDFPALPSSITSLADDAFKGCSDLRSIELSCVEVIGSLAFEGCTELCRIVLPSCVSSIGIGAFMSAYNLTDITYEGTMEQWNNITFGDDWNLSVPATTVKCSDGTVTL